MSSPYLSEIRLMSFSFPPKGWALCNGQALSIAQNTALFSLLGTTYGGDGIRTFNLPNLQGRVPLHFGTALDGSYYTLGELGGETGHTLTQQEIPQHNHLVQALAATADEDATGVTPGPAVVLAQPITSGAQKISPNAYGTGQPNGTMAGNAIGFEGGSQPHPNQQPFLVLNFCIALIGIFPSRG
jgi:microcystin-dependent protein